MHYKSYPQKRQKRYISFCPNCGKYRILGCPASVSRICKSCSMLGKQNRGNGHTLVPGYERVLNGRIYVRCNDGTEIAKHRLMAAYKLGRPISTYEVVRFIDSNHLNCDPANLLIVRSLPRQVEPEPGQEPG